jgi:glutamate formiminotransferase / 5-formyltetrahydrofolate cyclo-ligase
VLEAVPNVSEGRDAAHIASIGGAFARRARVLDVHSDPDHHRSVLTLAGEEGALVDSLVAGAVRAVELIDLREHDGVHPRVGAVDVVPLIALDDSQRGAADGATLAAAERIADEAGVPVFLYGRVAGGRRPAFFRRGGLHELVARIVSGELVPDFGGADVDPRSGVALVGSRDPLVAYNLELDTAELMVAHEIARAVRESSGGLPGVQAIGLRLPRAQRIQVSMNLVDVDATPLHELVERVRAEADARGARVLDGELVGLVPERVLAAAESAGVPLPGIDRSRVLERVLAEASL